MSSSYERQSTRSLGTLLFLTLLFFPTLTASSCTKRDRPFSTEQANPEAIVFASEIDEAFRTMLASGLALGWQVVLVDSPNRVITFRDPNRFGAYVTVVLTQIPAAQSIVNSADTPRSGIKVDASGSDRRSIERLFKQASGESGVRVLTISQWLGREEFDPVVEEIERRILEDRKESRNRGKP